MPRNGLCECGCGQRTNLITENNRSKGLVAGTYRRYATGHSVRARWLNHIKKERKPRLAGPDYVIHPETGCWIWQRGKTAGGYGQMYAGKPKRQIYSHRHYYQQAKGPIPEGLTIDHLCRNRACVNPDHLEAVPVGENTRRGIGFRFSAETAGEIQSSPLSNRKLARKFGVSHVTIAKVRDGTHWTMSA